MSILDTMKKVAEQSQNAAVPASFLFGQVTAVSPLVVRVDNRLDLPASALVALKEKDGDPLAIGDKLALLFVQIGKLFPLQGVERSDPPVESIPEFVHGARQFFPVIPGDDAAFFPVQTKIFPKVFFDTFK